MKNKTLLILAAGMGSRFGGLKQIEPVGPSGEFIIDYYIYDAIKCGFNKVVFIIKKENYEIFKEKVGNKFSDKVKIEYVFQDVNDLPEGYLNKNRIKPWGTTHAILCAKNVINEPFLMINADDFYGCESFDIASNYIDENNDESNYAIIAYKLINTVTVNGSVKRGVCDLNNGKVVGLIESLITMHEDKLIQKPLNSEEENIVSPDTLVSMNMIVLYPNIFKLLERKFIEFLSQNVNSDSKESLITDSLTDGINEGYCIINAVETNAKWSGVTYKEDLEELKTFIISQINNGSYPNKI